MLNRRGCCSCSEPEDDQDQGMNRPRTKETAGTDLGRGEAAGAPEADIAGSPDAATDGGGQPGPRHHGLAQGASWEESIVCHQLID